MTVYHINSIGIVDFINEFAQKLNTKADYHLGEYSLQLPENFGDVFIQGAEFANGIGIVKFKGNLSKNVAFHFTNTTTHTLKFLYSMEGSWEHAYKPGETWEQINQFQGAILSSHFNEGHLYKFKEQQNFCFYSIEVNRKKFLDLFHHKPNEMQYHFFRLFADVEGIHPYCFKSKYSIKVAHAIQELEESKLIGFLRNNLLVTKSLEVMGLMLNQFEEQQNAGEHKISTLKKTDLKIIHQIARHIQKHFATFESIEELSKQFGISKNKIQQGFQEEFSLSVNEFLKNVRLENALQMMENGEKNISEIVYALGLSSRSYFSKIFKEKYKVLPSAYLKNFDK